MPISVKLIDQLLEGKSSPEDILGRRISRELSPKVKNYAAFFSTSP